jgi:outer membrane protein assembly factor BamA
MISRHSTGRRVFGVLLWAALGFPTLAHGDSWRGGQSSPDGRRSPTVMSPPVTVADVFVQGNRCVSAKQVKAQILTRPGVRVTEEDLRRDVQALMRSRKFSKVEAITQRTHGGDVIVFFLIWEHAIKTEEVKEEPLVRVGQIFIVGNKKTRTSVILRRVRLFPGEILTYPDLKIAERNLARLNRFVVDSEKGIRPTVIPVPNPNDPDSAFLDILITVQEKETTDYFDELWDEVCDLGCDEVFDQFKRWKHLLRPQTRLELAIALLNDLFPAPPRFRVGVGRYNKEDADTEQGK